MTPTLATFSLFSMMTSPSSSSSPSTWSRVILLSLVGRASLICLQARASTRRPRAAYLSSVAV